VTKLIDIKQIARRLGYIDGMIQPQSMPEKIQANPTKFNLAKQTFEAIPEIEGIYFSGEYPLIYFKTLTDFKPEVIASLHRKIWNQGRVPLVFISSPQEIRIYNCFKEPVKDAENISSLEIDRFANAIEELMKFEENYHQSRMDSGLFWESNAGKKVNESASRKVDKRLVANLKSLRSKLLKELQDKVKDPIPYIHNVLGRSLFILYLEDRKIITLEYYSKFLANTQTYFDLLSNKTACYNLFAALNDKFNGDIFTVTSLEKRIITASHLNMVRDCFYGNNVQTGQLSLWRMFDFSYIPIELLSSIYEEFLHTEEGVEAISNQGAYYTPQPLVEFVLNEVLPFPDENNIDYRCKILDPACGSGIFLVEAYRRLIERWRYANPGVRVSINLLRSILQNSIFGIEKNNEAIKVASFSLYLTILNYLEPKYIWERVKFPYMIRSDHREDDHQGNNLFHGDTFELTEYADIDFDLIVGNPPWKRGNLDDSLNNYIKEHKLGNEAVLPFLHKMAFSAPNAKIALVSTAKILFNTTSGYEEFRRFLFNETKVDAIVNFAALRKSKGEIGRKLFASATGPTVIIFYNGVNIKERNDTIVYCTPKPQYKDSSITELIVDASDIKFVPQSDAIDPRSKVWKVAMWGTMRDYNLIKFLEKKEKLNSFIDKQGWNYGRGFQVSDPCDKPNVQISKLPFISNTDVSQYYTPKSNTIRVSLTKFNRLGCLEAYRAPHILIKKGQSNREFCASFLDYDCTFKDGVFGIHAKGQESLLKALTGYLNSRFATYYLFLTSASWGIEREQIFPTEVLNIPAPDFLLSEKGNEDIMHLVDLIIDELKKFSMSPELKINEYKKEIDKAILRNLGLNSNHLSLIDNLIDYNLSFFQEGIRSQAIASTRKSDIDRYAKTACKNIETLLVSSHVNFWATHYNVQKNSPLTLIALHFNDKSESGTVVYDEATNVGSLMESLNKVVYKQYSESIYFRKIIKHYDGDTLFIVKPNEKRFWTEAMALEDSDGIALEMMSSKV
jgi:type I restriction-modification system DNA methylase subunit